MSDIGIASTLKRKWFDDPNSQNQPSFAIDPGSVASAQSESTQMQGGSAVPSQDVIGRALGLGPTTPVDWGIPLSPAVQAQRNAAAQQQAPTPGVVAGQQGTGIPTTDSTAPSSQTGLNLQPQQASLNDYDYDPTYDQGINQLTASQNALNSQYSQAMQAANTKYQQPMSDLNLQHDQDTDLLQARMAQQGILRSSNNLYAQGNLNQGYQSQLGALTSQQQQEEEAASRARDSGIQDLIRQQAQLLSQHGDFVSQKELARAAQEAATKAANDALAQQQAMLKDQQDQANAAAQAFAQQNQVQASPTGQLAPAAPPAPPVNNYQYAPQPWGSTPGFLDDVVKQAWWTPQDQAQNAQTIGAPVAASVPPPPPNGGFQDAPPGFLDAINRRLWW